MKNAWKGALLSALIFPGVGHIWLRRYLRGLLLAGGALTCSALIVMKAVREALQIVGRIEAEGGNLDLVAVLKAAGVGSASAPDAGMSAAALGLLLFWVVGAVDAYLVGRNKDLAHRSADRTGAKEGRIDMSKRTVRELLLSMAAAFAVFACVPAGASGGGRSEIGIDRNADHTTVTLQVGERLLITLPGNPTTGYRWEVLPGFQPVLQEEGEPVYRPEGTQVPGRGGDFRFSFKGSAPGTTSVKLVYRRSFEEGVPPAQRFEVGVVVR